MQGLFRITMLVFTVALGLLYGGLGGAKAFAAQREVVINEVLYDPVGTDLGSEWVELYNPADSDADITGSKLQVAGSKYSDVLTLPENTVIGSKEYYLICEKEVLGCDFYVNKLGMQNGGSPTDGVRIVFPYGSSDTVLYGSPNSNKLVDDSGEISKSEETALNVVSGHSLARKTATDTNNCAIDFVESYEPTPGEQNVTSFAGRIVLSEVSFIDKMIEFYAKATNPNTSGWYIKQSESATRKVLLPTAVPYPLFTLGADIRSWDCVFLYSPDGEVQDKVCIKNSSTLYSVCRLDIEIEQQFTKCSPTLMLQT